MNQSTFNGKDTKKYEIESKIHFASKTMEIVILDSDIHFSDKCKGILYDKKDKSVVQEYDIQVLENTVLIPYSAIKLNLVDEIPYVRIGIITEDREIYLIKDIVTYEECKSKFNIITMPDEKNYIYYLSRKNLLSLKCVQIDEFIELEKKYEYLVTIVMAVYNTEEYIAEAVKSILNQNITGALRVCMDTSAEKLCQIILVDDGSTDSSAEVCDDLARYNDNIYVIHQDNKGVSAARNIGMQLAKGKYLNFMDSDDILDTNVFSECIPYFDKNYEMIQMVAFPMKFFEGKSGNHWLNDKFIKGKKLSNLLIEYKNSVISCSSGFFKTDTIVDNYCFDEEILTGEDIKLIYTLLIDNEPIVGLVGNCNYRYRRRIGKEKSAIQNQRIKMENYVPYLERVMKYLFIRAKDKYGSVPLYLQNMCAQQLQYRFIKNHDEYELAKSIMSESEIIAYKKLFLELFSMIDDNVIMDQTKMYAEHKKYLMEKKYGECYKQYTEKGICYYLGGRVIAREEYAYVMIESLIYNKDKIVLSGYYKTFEESIRPFVCINGIMTKIDNFHMVKDTFLFEESVYPAVHFEFTYDTCENKSIQIVFWELCGKHFLEKNKLRLSKEVEELCIVLKGNTVNIKIGEL